jgi:hypothetical protein
LLNLDLPFTVQLEDRQEADHHVDPVFAIRDQLAERRLSPVEGAKALLDVIVASDTVWRIGVT